MHRVKQQSDYGLAYGAKFWRGKILTNRHLENFDEKKFDKFYNINAHIINS